MWNACPRHRLMRASPMFLRPLCLVGFSSCCAALKMDAPIITRNTLLRNFTPLLTPQNLSHVLFVNVGHQFRQRSSRRLYAASSEPPCPLLHPKVVSRERDSNKEAAKDDGTTGSTKEECKPTASSAIPRLHGVEEGLIQEAVKEEFKRASSVFSNDMAFKNVGRQRERKTFVAKTPTRLYSDEEDLMYMQEALVEAKKAAKKGEVPVGAVLVHNNNIIARFHNQVEATGDPTAHAEMLCIRSAAAQLGGWRLTDVTMYVTLEPCPMCAGAILQGRVSELVWGARNSLLGADGSWIKVFPVSSSCEHEPKGKDYLHPFHKTITVRRGVLAEESADIMQTFFAMRRLQPKCRTDDAHVGVKSAPWPRSPGWLPPAFKKLNSWVRRWFQF